MFIIPKFSFSFFQITLLGEPVQLSEMIYEMLSDWGCFRLYSQFCKIQPRTSWKEAYTLDFDLLTYTVNPLCPDSLSYPREKTGFKNAKVLYSPETMWFKLQYVSQLDLCVFAFAENWRDLQTLPFVFPSLLNWLRSFLQCAHSASPSSQRIWPQMKFI